VLEERTEGKVLSMTTWTRQVTIGFAFSITAAMMGCAGSITYRTYDPYYHDYHVWNAAEVPYYNRWTVETRHPNVEYQHLHKNDQQAYWRWRHDHP
jgi:hypothetical protein